MQTQYDLKRYAVLYVDDEEKALKYFEKTFGDEFRIFTANNAADGLKLIEQHGEDIGVLLSDQRMPGEKGVQLLERARQIRPRLVRMIITAFADYDVTVDAVNLGNIFRYISKPCTAPWSSTSSKWSAMDCCRKSSRCCKTCSSPTGSWAWGSSLPG